ncbi:MAG: hypothetical protein RLZZ480_631 [Candidatus Parcubacteria bacterium]|jgi:tetratricopeptide (TPR) repeat protein
MSGSLFTPRVYQEQPNQNGTEQPRRDVPDKIGTMVLKFVQYLVIGLLFLIPVFFVPGLPASLGFDKVLVVTTFSFLAIVLLGLSALRYNKVSTVLPLSLGLFWLFVAIAFISGLLSGDIQDALRGSVFEPQTAGFFVVLGLAMTLPLVLQRSKMMALRSLMFFGGAAVIATLYTLVRLFLSPGALSFGSFGAVTVSPVGSFNDLAIFSALTILLTLITLLQLPLKRASQAVLSGLVVLSLAIMAVVNFFHLWIVVGFFGLLLLVYIFSRDTLLYSAPEERNAAVSPYLIGTTLVVCVMSIIFVVAGDFVGTKISNATQVNYIEVRPSVTATIDIARGVYSNDILLGTGPNRFGDAWRLHKDRSINETIFWGTNFNAGFGFVPTLFVTLGILGGLAVLAFHASYLYLGYKMLLRGNSSDTFWYYFGVATFVSAVFLWGMSYVYVSGPVILLLAALFTGLSFVAYQALMPAAVRTIPLVNSRRRGFFLMMIAIIIITGCVSAVFTVGKQYVAQAGFTKARLVETPDEFQTLVAQAYQQYHDDTFAIASAQVKLGQLRQMLNLQNPSEEDQNKFLGLAGSAISDARMAVSLDDSNPEGHATLASIFILLNGVGVKDAENNATAKLEDAKWRDPLNPGYAMMAAYMAVQLNDTRMAREHVAKALQLKQNYSEALLLLSQLDVKDGNIDGAISTTRQMITLEPNNAVRYYQLGVLLAAKKDLEGAIKAYEAAVLIDKNFANARYMMALTLYDMNRRDDALTQLRIVRETNQDNEQLKTIISQMESNTFNPQGTNPGSVNEQAPQEQQNGETVTAPGGTDTNLVTPVNTVNEGQESTETPAPEQNQAQ